MAVLYYLLSFGFVVYGFFRLLGAGLLFALTSGRWGGEGLPPEVLTQLQDGAAKVEGFLATHPETLLIDLSLPGYFGYSALMGAVLFVGGFLSLLKNKSGWFLIALYHILFALMFLNYGALNAKLLHLAVSFGLFLALVFLGRERLRR
jgi:hypothetical protein